MHNCKTSYIVNVKCRRARGLLRLGSPRVTPFKLRGFARHRGLNRIAQAALIVRSWLAARGRQFALAFVRRAPAKQRLFRRGKRRGGRRGALQNDAVNGAGGDAQFTPNAIIAQDGVHKFFRADDAIHRAGGDAPRAADAIFFNDACDLQTARR